MIDILRNELLGKVQTMKDLQEMAEAAKEAQWGEVESGAGSDGQHEQQAEHH